MTIDTNCLLQGDKKKLEIWTRRGSDVACLSLWRTKKSWSSMPNLSLRFRNTRGQYSLNLKWLGMFSLSAHTEEIKTSQVTFLRDAVDKRIWRFPIYCKTEWQKELTCWRGGCPLWSWNRPWSRLAWAWWESEHGLTHLSVQKKTQKRTRERSVIYPERPYWNHITLKC